VNASGATGGGLVRIGGQFRGGNADASQPLYQSYVGRWGTLPPIAAATTVTIDAGTRINVSARNVGDGGTVVIWSNERTSFAGEIRGTAGMNSGSGSYAEVSSKGVLDFSGHVNLKASNGPNGTLLLDPSNLTISTGATSNETSSGATRILLVRQTPPRTPSLTLPISKMRLRARTWLRRQTAPSRCRIRSLGRTAIR
jgi:hypothetical protein